MSNPQILIQKAYITVQRGPEIEAIAGMLEPLTISSLGDQVSHLIYPDMTRFSVDKGIVYDPVTGLMWAQQEIDELEWEEANKACSDSRLGGFSDWRMPTRTELLTIIDLERCKPALPPIFETAGDYNWTSTQTAWTKDKAGSSRSFFYVHLGNGYVYGYYDAYNRLRARPVRRAAPASQ